MKPSQREIILMVNDIIAIFNLTQSKTLNENEERVIDRAIIRITSTVDNKYTPYWDVIINLLESSKLINKALIDRRFDPCELHRYFMRISIFSSKRNKLKDSLYMSKSKLDYAVESSKKISDDANNKIFPNYS